jgi:hypothetical protein
MATAAMSYRRAATQPMTLNEMKVSNVRMTAVRAAHKKTFAPAQRG